MQAINKFRNQLSAAKDCRERRFRSRVLSLALFLCNCARSQRSWRWLSLLLAVNVVGCQSCSSFVAWFRCSCPFLLLLLLRCYSCRRRRCCRLLPAATFVCLCVCVARRCCRASSYPLHYQPPSPRLYAQLLRYCSSEAAAASVPRTRVSAPSLSQCHSRVRVRVRVRVSASSSLYVYILRRLRSRASGCVCASASARVFCVCARVLKAAGSMGREKRCILSGAT